MVDAIKIASLKDRVDRVANDPRSHPLLRTPTHQRISDAADWLLREFGIRGVTLEQIAERSSTNTAFVVECVGSLEDLVVDYLRLRVAEQTRKDDQFWTRVQGEHPRDEKEQLRAWVYMVAPSAMDRFEPLPFALQTIDLLYDVHHPGRAIIKQYKTAVRDRLARICCDAFYRTPEILADKLLMLAEGAFVQRALIDGERPGQRLIEAAEDLFKRHWQSE